MKQLFHIKNSSIENEQLVLSLRLGERHGCFVVTDKSGNKLHELAYCTIEGWDENTLTDFLISYPIFKSSFYKVQVVYDYFQSDFVPAVSYKPDDASLLLKTTKGNFSLHIISELVSEWQLYNVYAVPKDVHEFISKKFATAICRHQYSLALKRINAAGSAGCLLVDFTTDEFSLLAVKDSRLLLAQTFGYSTPEDVLYSLLKVCQQFSLSQTEVQLQLSGLLDQQSALYNELHQYFIHMEFMDASWNMAGSEYPAHFFTSLNDLARCAS